MNKRPFKQVDVFTVSPFSGNPVAVVLDGSNFSDSQMMQFAKWTNLAETTFILPPQSSEADYSLRIFTTSRELPFAGHPTLGSCHAWLEHGGRPRHSDYIIQECGKGLIKIRCVNGILSFQAPKLNASGPLDESEVQIIARGLGLERCDILHHAWCDNGPKWRGIMLQSAEKVLSISNIDCKLLLNMDVGVIGPHEVNRKCPDDMSTGSGEDTIDFEVRAFCPDDCPMEDPATGSLNAAMGQWLIGAGLAPPLGYVARQGTALGRNARIHVDRDNITGVIWIGGSCVTRIEGELYV